MLLDEACGLRKKEELVPAQGLQQGTAEVASWNKKRVCPQGAGFWEGNSTLASIYIYIYIYIYIHVR